MKYSRIFIVSILCLWRLVANAQQAVLYHLNERSGLSDDQVNCFLQDSRGMMWMGTSYGLNLYDASRCRVFKYPLVSDNVITDLAESEDHEIWISTANGLTCYVPGKNIFQRYYFKPGHDRMNSFSAIAILGDSIFIGTENGLLIFNRSKRRFVTQCLPVGADGASRITRLYKDREGQLWLCTYDGIWQFDQRTAKCYPLGGDDKTNGLHHELMNDLVQTADGTYYAGSWSKGLFSFSKSKPQPVSWLGLKGGHTNVITLTTLRNAQNKEELWLSNSLSTLNLSERRFDFHEFFGEGSYSDINVLKLYTDRNNMLWIATTAGVFIYDPAVQFFKTDLLTNGVPYSTQGVAQMAAKDGFWLGGESGNALVKYDRQMKIRKNYSSLLHDHTAVMNIQEDGKGRLWLSTTTGVYISDETVTHFTHWSMKQPKPNDLPRDFINGVFHCSDGRVWVFPWRIGVWIRDEQAALYPLMDAQQDTLLRKSNIAMAVEDSLGHIWLADYDHGLHCYDLHSGHVKTLIDHKRFSNIYLLGKDVWVASAEGLIRTNIQNFEMKFFPFPEDKGRYTFNFIPDALGGLWIATKTGLLHFDTLTQTYRYFTVSDGLKTNYLDVTFCKLNDGRLLMAGSTFLTSFDPARVKVKKKLPPLLLTQISTNSHDLDLSQKKIETQWKDNTLTFYWAFLHYNNPTGNEYFYKMDGIDDDWKAAGNTGKAIYNSLQPGEYRFHYKARSSDRMLAAEHSIAFIVHPPYWQTLWFRLSIVLLAAFIFYLIVRYIAQRNLKERILQLEKTQAIEKERFRISRDMHDELGSGLTKIAILSEVMKQTKDNKAEVIDKISHTARSLVNNLDEMVWALNPHNDTLQQLIAYVSEQAIPFFENTKIEFDQQIPDDIPHVLLGEEKRRALFLCIREFLNNSLKHSNARQVTLCWTFEETQFSFVIADNGKGFDTRQKDKNGNGLKNMETRMKEINALYSLKSDDTGTVLRVSCGY